jgi:hypothetical protein
MIYSVVSSPMLETTHEREEGTDVAPRPHDSSIRTNSVRDYFAASALHVTTPYVSTISL